MNERIIQREETRESYFAPTYQIFSFETSDLMQTSGDQPVALPSAYFGNMNDASTAVFEGENADW